MGDRLREYIGKLSIMMSKMMSFVFCLDLWTQCEYQARPNRRLLTHHRLVHMRRNFQCTECDYRVTQKGSLCLCHVFELCPTLLWGSLCSLLISDILMLAFPPTIFGFLNRKIFINISQIWLKYHLYRNSTLCYLEYIGTVTRHQHRFWGKYFDMRKYNN